MENTKNKLDYLEYVELFDSIPKYLCDELESFDIFGGFNISDLNEIKYSIGWQLHKRNCNKDNSYIKFLGPDLFSTTEKIARDYTTIKFKLFINNEEISHICRYG